MKFFKSYTGGLVVLAAAIVLSVLLGSHRSLVQAREKVETERFASVAEDLQDCLDITANLLTVAGRYLEGGDLRPLADARAALAESGGISEAYSAYTGLTAEAEALLLALEAAPLEERDGEYVQGFRADLAAEADTISRDGYNAAAEDFNRRVLGAFPANILSKLTFVAPAELFQ